MRAYIDIETTGLDPAAAELTVVALEMGLVERPISVCRLMGDPNAVCTVDDTNVQASPAGRSESRKLVLSSQS